MINAFGYKEIKINKMIGVIIMSVLALKDQLNKKMQGVQNPQGLHIQNPQAAQTHNPQTLQTAQPSHEGAGAHATTASLFANPPIASVPDVEAVVNVEDPSAASLGNPVLVTDETGDMNLPKDIGFENTELTTIDSNYLALTTNAIDIITENLKNQPLSYQLFDIVKAPTGGATVFTVPGLAGDEIAKELTGIILDYTTPRAYWETPEPVEGTPPTCYSPDSIVSVEGKPCSTCLFNTFGSKGLNGNGAKDGDSQARACKESIQALLLLPDSVIPIIVRIPVTSKVIFQKYMTRLVSRMIPLNGVVTKVTLEKATSNGGQPYAKFNFEAVEVLSPEEASHARAYGQKFSEMLSAGHDVGEVYEAPEYQGNHGIGDTYNTHNDVDVNDIHVDHNNHQSHNVINPHAPNDVHNV